MISNYITSERRTSRPKPAVAQIIISVFLAAFIGLSGLFASTSKEDKSAEAFDAVQWVMCYFGDDSIPAMVYQSTQSSDLQFAFRSKSSITGGVDKVDSGLNWILDMFGPGFKSVNESITGYSIDPFDPTVVDGTAPPAKENFNKGAKVNPFDRFGVAGLKFTAYTGEWKHVVIDACNTDTAPQDPKAGVFYEGRLEARSTWEDISNSRDIRSMQFDKGFGTQFGVSMADIFANGIFTGTKAIVVVTIGLINFAFADIVEIMGLNEILAGGSSGGIFGLLFNGVFTPLIIIIFVLTGGYIFWNGIVKRQYRQSMTTLLRSLALFIIAVIIAAAPLSFITLPNKIAVVGQSIILTTMNSGLSGGNGMCSTDIGKFETKLVNNPNAKEQDILTEASESMRSAIGCQFWQMFLLKPWAEGQFGTDWEQLWANGKMPDWADRDTSAELKNENESMVGDAAVPMGDGSFIHNWALFQISAQTNAHSAIGHEGEKPKYTAGVANDWWRIVDTLSNYQEEEVTAEATGSGANGTANTVTYTAPKTSTISPHWDTWVGNTAANRMWTASSSVLIALIGMAAPLFFAFLSAIYSFGIALLMAFAPIMFLLGCWAGKGWEIFKGWGELVINTTLKRIVTGALLAIAIGLEAAAIQMMETIGWWQGILMLILLSVIIIKSRGKIIDSLASIKFASTNFGANAEKMNRMTTGAIKSSTKMASSTVVAGVNSKRYGGDFKSGALAGAKNELNNLSYQLKPLRQVMTQKEVVETSLGKTIMGQESCASCGKEMKYEEDQYGLGVMHGGRSIDGNIYCLECFRDGVDEDAVAFVANKPDPNDVARKRDLFNTKNGKNNEKINTQQAKLASSQFATKTAFNNSVSQRKIELLQSGIDSDGQVLNDRQKTAILRGLLKAVNFDIDSHMRGNGEMPAVPAEIQESINHEVLEAAWKTGRYDWVKQAYTAAWANWFVETTGGQLNTTLEDLLNSLEKKDEKDPKDNK